MSAKALEKPELTGKIIGLPQPDAIVVDGRAPGEPAVGAMSGGSRPKHDKSARELYIGNVPSSGITEAQLAEFINSVMKHMKLTIGEGNPVVRTRLSPKFAFAEFRSVQECNRALNLNGIELAGRELRIRRPNSYTGPTVNSVMWSQLQSIGIEAVEAMPAGSAAPMLDATMPMLPTSLVPGTSAEAGKPSLAIQLIDLIDRSQ